MATRVDKTTIAEQIKKEEVNIVRNQKVLALMESRGRITFNHSGKKMEWNVRTKRGEMTPYSDGEVQTFGRVDRHQEASLPWRGYITGESSGKLEALKQQGPEARVKIIAELTQYMMDDIRYNFAREFWKDGNAAENASRIHGFPSFLGYTGSDQWAAPSDTYAGLTTALGGLGGAIISGTWPDGQFDPEYDAWSPLIVNYTHSGWAATSDTWANNVIEVLRAAIIHNNNTRGTQQGLLDLGLMTAEMYRQALAAFETKERLNIERGANTSAMVALGFRDTVNFDGVDFSYESDIPAGECHGLKLNQAELCSMQGQLFIPSDDYDLETISKRYSIDFFGNLKCNPRGFVLWKNIT